MRSHDIRRLLRRNEWAPVHDGIYVNHTGPLTWWQRAWAAVLYAAPAALCLESALTDEGAVIHVAVSRDRGVLAEPYGVRIHHVAHLQERVLWHVGPPRLRFDRPCRTAAKITQVMRRHGITVSGDACGPACEFGRLDLAA